MRSGLSALAVAALACNSVSVVQESFPVEPIARRTDSPPISLEPRVEVTAAGDLRFFSPRACEMRIYKREQVDNIRTVRPNLATVIVGLALGSISAVTLATGLAGDDPAGSASTWGGAAGVAVGVSLVALPYVGNTTRRTSGETNEFPASTRQELCGKDPVDARSAVVTFQNIRIAGLIDPEGRFSIPVFHFIDVFDFDRIRGSASAMLADGGASPHSIDWILDAESLTVAQSGFVRAQQFDASVRELDKVPRLNGDQFAVVLDRGDPYPIALVTVTIRNDGPGAAWGVRARLDSAVPELRSRFIYVGRLGAGKSTQPVLAIPLADSTIDLRTADLSLTILDAHKTAPTVPLTRPSISSR